MHAWQGSTCLQLSSSLPGPTQKAFTRIAAARILDAQHPAHIRTPRLCAGLDVGDEHGDADLASLLGPIAADVGDVGPSLGGSSVGSPSRLPLAATLQRPASAPLHGASPQRVQQQPSLLDGLALQQAAAAQQLGGGGSSSALSATAAQAAAAARDGGVLVALAHCLWACAPFRRLVLSWPEIVYKADPVVAALWRALAAYAGAAAGGSVAQLGPAGVAAAAELSDTLAGHLFGTGGGSGCWAAWRAQAAKCWAQSSQGWVKHTVPGILSCQLSLSSPSCHHFRLDPPVSPCCSPITVLHPQAGLATAARCCWACTSGCGRWRACAASPLGWTSASACS